METLEPTPLHVCMQNDRREDMTIKVVPGDTFRTFLDKAKELLGFEIDVSCITQNQVSLSENIYDFLINANPEQLNPTVVQEDAESALQLLAVQDQSETVYVLEDGTQVNTSKLNESSKLDIEKIPFVKYANAEPKQMELSTSPGVMKWFNIAKSPLRPHDTMNLPFRPVSKHNYEYGKSTYRQNSRHREKRMSKLTVEIQSQFGTNYPVDYDISRLTRDDVLTMVKDSPVIKTIEFIEENEKQKHARKIATYKVPENSSEAIRVDVAMSIRRGESGSYYCFICNTLIQNHLDEIYLFDSEDQKAYRSSPKREQATPLKVICNTCLNIYFKYSLELLTEKTLEVDEYLIIRRNQQYLYQRILPLPQRTFKQLTVEKMNPAEPQFIVINEDIDDKSSVIENNVNFNVKSELSHLNENKMEDVKPNIVVDSKIDDRQEDVKTVNREEQTEKKLRTEDYDEVEFLEDLDDCVIVEQKELKCRFCSKIFPNVDEAVEHGTEHWLIKEKVFPCPLCEYGYQTFLWLRGHMYSKHNPGDESKGPNRQSDTPTPSCISSLCNSDDQSRAQSPVASRTRNSAGRKRPTPSKKKDKSVKKMKPSKKMENKSKKVPTSDASNSDNTMNIITPKEETRDAKAADDELWIVQCGPSYQNLKKFNKTRIYPCLECKKTFISRETLACHVARKCKTPNIIVNTKRTGLLNLSAKRYKRKTQTLKEVHNYIPKRRVAGDAEPGMMTCDDCGSAFTSKVRLNFHMQFHMPTALLTAAGRFLCERCPADSSFATESELYDHVHFTHEKRRRHACPVPGCDKSFFLRSMLTKHGRSHTNTRLYVCSECGKRFLDKQTLDEHSVTHLKRKPFECHICQKQLTRRSRLRMHLKAHEDSLTPRPLHACRLCWRAFKDLHESKEHVINAQCSRESRESFDQINSEDTKEVNMLPNVADSEEAKSMLNELSDDTKRLITIVEVDKVFRCEYCEDVFCVPECLIKHRVLHQNVEEPFICHICKVAFPTYSRCTTHKTTHGYYKRSLQAKSSQPGDANREMAPSTSGILGYGDFPVAKHFLCGDCGRTYLHWTYFQVHRRIKHPTGDEASICLECGLAYPNSWALSYHKRKVHSGNVKNDKENCKPRSYVKIPCRDCQEVFLNKSALYTHRRKMHVGLEPHASKRLGLFSCATCKKCYSNKPGLEAHLRAAATSPCAPATSPCAPAPPTCASTAEPYACARCSAAFAYCDRLARHIMEAHAKEATHMCSACGATFPSRSELAAHSRLHPPARAYACPVCARVFRTASVYSEHLRVHTGERPFPCDICGMSFRRSTARNNHRLIHTGERAFSCERCPKSFRIRSDLRAHIRNKHPERVLVMEMRGLSPQPEDVIRQLLNNSITLENVVEITKVSYAKGTPNLMMNGDSASLETLQAAQQDISSQKWSERMKVAIAANLPRRDTPTSSAHGNHQAQQWRRGRGICRQPTRNQLEYRDEDTFHVAIKDVAVEELTQLLGGVLTTDGKGVLLTSGEFVPFNAVLKEESTLRQSEEPQPEYAWDSMEQKNRMRAIEEPPSTHVEQQDIIAADYRTNPNYQFFEQKLYSAGDEAAQNRFANRVETEQSVHVPVGNGKALHQYNEGKSMLSPRDHERISEKREYILGNSEISQTSYTPEVSGNHSNRYDYNLGMQEGSQPNSCIPDGNGKTSGQYQRNFDSEDTPIGSVQTSEPNQYSESSETSQKIMYTLEANEIMTDQYRYSMGNNESQSNFITAEESIQMSEQYTYNLGNEETSQPVSYIPDGSEKSQYSFVSNESSQANFHTLQVPSEHQYSMGNSETFQRNLCVPNGRSNSINYQYNLVNNVTQPILYTPEEYEQCHYSHGNNHSAEPLYIPDRSENPQHTLYNPEQNTNHCQNNMENMDIPQPILYNPAQNTDHNQNNMGNNEIPRAIFFNPEQNPEQCQYDTGNYNRPPFLYTTEGSTICHL